MESAKNLPHAASMNDSCGAKLEKGDDEHNKRDDKSVVETQEVVLVEESSAKNEELRMYSKEWFDKMINTKVNTVVARFSKFARVLKCSYPSYRRTLDRIEAKIGMPVCKLDPPHRCPLDRAIINRWEFTCTRKPIMESENSKTEADKEVRNVWVLESCDGSNTSTNESLQMIPTFVTHAVKIFENFINSFNGVPAPEVKVKKEDDDDDVVVLENDEKLPDSAETSGSTSESDISPQWSWLLVRSNSKGELMLFATGKYITNSIMEGLKHLFESGVGKDCNVKSLYCKAMTKINGVHKWNTTFLIGNEALDETVGKLKIQLAPKTNFWLCTSGAEELAKTVEAFLDPPDLSTIIDIGCGLGLIGLSLAHRCYQVIGIDSPSEVEEAEITCELNKIKNAYFLMGEPVEMMTTVEKTVEWRKTLAIVNANTNMGRTVEVMTGLRKIKNLRRIVLVTTLTKQSVRSILELTRPANEILGDPFVAIRATVVDTLPTGTQFEVIIQMERRPLSQMFSAVVSQVFPDLAVQNPPINVTKSPPKKNPVKRREKPAGKKFNFVKNTVALAKKRRATLNGKLLSSHAKPVTGCLRGEQNENRNRIPMKKFVKNPFYEQPFTVTNVRKNMDNKKLPPLDTQNHTNQYKVSSGSRLDDNVNQQNSSAISKPCMKRNAPRRATINSTLYTKNQVNDESFRASNNSQKRRHEWDLGITSSHNPLIQNKRSREDNDDVNARISAQVEFDLLQKVKEQQCILEVAKQKLTGASSQVADHFTAEEVQKMLNLAIERTNQIESQIPRSVQMRPTLPKDSSPDIIVQEEIMVKGRHVQAINQADIVITTSNRELTQTFDTAWSYNRRSGVPPLEPNLVMPRDGYTNVPSDFRGRQLEHPNNLVQQREERWVPPLNARRPSTPLIHSMAHGSLPGNVALQQQQAPIQLQGIVRPSRQFASMQRSRSPPRQKISVAPQDVMHMRSSPNRRQPVSVEFNDEWDIPSRDAAEKQTSYQHVVNNHQEKISTSRWSTGGQHDEFHQGNNLNSNWNANKCADDNNWANESRGLSGNWDTRNRNQILVDQTVNKQWQPQHQQISTGQQFGRSGGNNWNVRRNEVAHMNNTRNEAWINGNERTRNEPQSNENSRNQNRNMEHWNDLPEDARDPWGDDSDPSGPTQGDWRGNSIANERSMAVDNWRPSGPSTINPRPQWNANMNFANVNMTKPNTNMNNVNWNSGGVRDDNMKKAPQIMNWQQGNGNDSNNGNRNVWPQRHSFGGFPPPRPYN